MLMLPETFAEQPARPVAGDRVADAFARDHPQFWRRTFWQPVPVGNETTVRQPFTLLAHAGEIPVLPKPPAATQGQSPGIGRLASRLWGLFRHEHAG